MNNLYGLVYFLTILLALFAFVWYYVIPRTQDNPAWYKSTDPESCKDVHRHLWADRRPSRFSWVGHNGSLWEYTCPACETERIEYVEA